MDRWMVGWVDGWLGEWSVGWVAVSIDGFLRGLM